MPCICICLFPYSAPAFPLKRSRRRVHPRYASEKGAPSAAVSKIPVISVVVLAVVLGSRTVEMPATQTLIIHGSRACRPAKVIPLKVRILTIACASCCHCQREFVRTYVFTITRIDVCPYCKSKKSSPTLHMTTTPVTTVMLPPITTANTLAEMLKLIGLRDQTNWWLHVCVCVLFYFTSACPQKHLRRVNPG